MSDTTYLKGSCAKCGNHIEFPKEMSGATITCPHCAQSTELVAIQPAAPAAAVVRPKRSGIKLIVGLCLVLVLAAASFLGWKYLRAKAPPGSPTSQTTSTNSPSPVVATPTTPAVKRPKAIEDLKIGEIKLEKTTNNSLIYAVGTLTNDSEYERFGVRIELDLFNSQQVKIGTAKEYQALLEPHKNWQFRALVIDSKTASVRLDSIKEE